MPYDIVCFRDFIPSMVQPPPTKTRDPLTRLDLGRDIDSAARERSSGCKATVPGYHPKTPLTCPLAPHLPFAI